MPALFEIITTHDQVPITETGVDTATFLEACEGIIQLFGLFHSTVFDFVKEDVRKNTQGTRDRFLAKPAESSTLEDLVINEKAEGLEASTGALIRVLRGLALISAAIHYTLEHPDQELRSAFQFAYDEILRSQHNSWIRWLVSLALFAVPYRTVFFATLTQDGSREKLDERLLKALNGLDMIVARMSVFLLQGNHGKIYDADAPPVIPSTPSSNTASTLTFKTESTASVRPNPNFEDKEYEIL